MKCCSTSHNFENVALAVSKTDKLEVGKAYASPAGWHWGNTAEVEAIMDGGEEAWELPKAYYKCSGAVMLRVPRLVGGRWLPRPRMVAGKGW
jgi:hypothetical protein